MTDMFPSIAKKNEIRACINFFHVKHEHRSQKLDRLRKVHEARQNSSPKTAPEKTVFYIPPVNVNSHFVSEKN